jgi:hypothetical protein
VRFKSGKKEGTYEDIDQRYRKQGGGRLIAVQLCRDKDARQKSQSYDQRQHAYYFEKNFIS